MYLKVSRSDSKINLIHQIIFHLDRERSLMTFDSRVGSVVQNYSKKIGRYKVYISSDEEHSMEEVLERGTGYPKAQVRITAQEIFASCWLVKREHNWLLWSNYY